MSALNVEQEPKETPFIFICQFGRISKDHSFPLNTPNQKNEKKNFRRKLMISVNKTNEV